jgi:GT2 family glycosyltransferase
MNDSSQPLVHIVVVTYDGKRFLEDCLGSLLTTDYEAFRLFLVDNGSSDGSGEFAVRRFPDATVLRQDPNRGYAGGANVGLKRALADGAKYVALLNDDTAVLDRRWLTVGVTRMQSDPQVGVVGFTMASSMNAPRPEHVEVHPVDYLPGFALLLRTDMLRDIGIFDEVYGVYSDEDDFEARACAAGYRLVRADTPIFHHGSGTNGKYSRSSGFLQMRNSLRHKLKNRGLFSACMRALRIVDVACSPYPLSMDRADEGHLRMRNSGNIAVNAWLLAKAVGWNLRHWPETRRIRQEDYGRVEQARTRLRRRLANCSTAEAVIV